MRSFLQESTAEAIPSYADALVKVDYRAGNIHGITFMGLGSRDDVSVKEERTGAEDASLLTTGY